MLGYETPTYNITTDLNLAVNYRAANLQGINSIQIVCPQLSNPNNPYTFGLVDVIPLTSAFGSTDTY